MKLCPLFPNFWITFGSNRTVLLSVLLSLLKSWEDSKRRRQYFKLLKNLNDFKAFEFLYIRHLRITNSSLEKKYYLVMLLRSGCASQWEAPTRIRFWIFGLNRGKIRVSLSSKFFYLPKCAFCMTIYNKFFHTFFLSLVKFRNSFIIKILRFLFLLKDFSALSNQRFKS